MIHTTASYARMLTRETSEYDTESEEPAVTRPSTSEYDTESEERAANDTEDDDADLPQFKDDDGWDLVPAAARFALGPAPAMAEHTVRDTLRRDPHWETRLTLDGAPTTAEMGITARAADKATTRRWRGAPRRAAELLKKASTLAVFPDARLLAKCPNDADSLRVLDTLVLAKRAARRTAPASDFHRAAAAVEAAARAWLMDNRVDGDAPALRTRASR